MANNPTDPAVEEADRRAERAKASLRARFAVLERRLGDVRDRIDLPEQIRRHPLPAVGIAFAFGAFVGSRRRRAAGHAASPAAPALAHKPRTLGGTALTLLSALGLPLLRELAIAQLKRTAAHWWSERGGSHPEYDPARGYSPYAEP